ncbi:MAG: peptidase MA family metallohydrolase [Candidatus Aquicultor sp.]|nr:peptidase MA family metallohydrolase [Candidatus Aquicultor sp.]
MEKHILKTIILTLIICVLSAGVAVAVESEPDWKTYETEHFTIHASARANVEEIGRLAEATYNGMSLRYNDTDPQKINLYIYTSRSAFLGESPSTDAAGYASPGSNLIAILQGAGNSTKTLTHEINHIIFLRNVARMDTVPQWFIEGLALYESQPGAEAAELEKYALARDIPDFIERGIGINDGPATRREYADGYLKVNFIVNKFGRDKLYETIGRLQTGAVFDQALVESLGVSEDGLNTAWNNYARGQRVSIWVMQLRDIGWYVMTALLVIVMFVFPIQRYRRLRAMDDDEQYEDYAAENLDK